MLGARLRFVTGPDRGAEARLDGRAFRAGSSLGNDLRLDDESAVRHHLELRLRDEGYRLQDRTR